MEETNNTKYELGFLQDRKDNRYWQIKLGKMRSLTNGIAQYRRLMAIFNFLGKMIGVIIFFFLLIPICIIALIISIRLKKREGKAGNINEGTRRVLEVYERFMNVYPARVYSPILKAMEVGFLRNQDLRPPSLEIAIGDGYLSSLVFGERGYNLTIGSDMIYETILSSIKYNHIDKLVVCDAVELPFPDNCFNTVIMNNLMHHLPSRKKTLREIERVLKPGGKFFFQDNLRGWIEYTFDSRILRFFHLNFMAKKIEAFKLNLFAQKLLTSRVYWEEGVKETEMEVLVNQEFMSKKALTIGSIFEYLNLLQGQPTRESMRILLKIGFLKKFIDKKFSNIIKYLIINEQKLIEKNQGAFLFVVLRKGGEVGDIGEPARELKYACLKCKNELEQKGDQMVCQECGQEYPIRKGVPIFLSYQEKLKEFENYLDTTDKREVKEYIT